MAGSQCSFSDSQLESAKLYIIIRVICMGTWLIPNAVNGYNLFCFILTGGAFCTRFNYMIAPPTSDLVSHNHATQPCSCTAQC